MFGITKTKSSKTFKVLSLSSEPVIQYIPEEADLRNKIFKEFEEKNNVVLPKWEDINVVPWSRKCEFVLLLNDIELNFEYLKRKYKIVIRKGTIYDGASVPYFLSFGQINRISNHTALPSLVHDILYADKFFPRIDSDDIFEGLLRYKKMKGLYIFCFLSILRIFGSKFYKKSKKYLFGFYYITKLFEQPKNDE